MKLLTFIFIISVVLPLLCVHVYSLPYIHFTSDFSNLSRLAPNGIERTRAETFRQNGRRTTRKK